MVKSTELIFLAYRSPCFEQSSFAQGSPEVCHCHKHQSWHFWYEDPQNSERCLFQKEEAEEASSPGGRDLRYRERSNLICLMLLFSFQCGWAPSCLMFSVLLCVEVPADRAEERGPESSWRSAPAPREENPSVEGVSAFYLQPVQRGIPTQAGFLNVL